MAAARVPVTVLCGFLGSGKTTLLNHLLRADHGFRLAVIVNEFGEVGVDGRLSAGGEQFVELDNGCLCCQLNAELEELIGDLRERGGFDHVLIETTGVADPLPVAWTFARKGVHDFYRLDAIVTVVDAAHLDRALAESPIAELQVERADLLLLNKLDLVPGGDQAAEDTLRSINPVAPVLRTHFARAPWELVLTSDEPSRVLDAGAPPGPAARSHRPSSDFQAWTHRFGAAVDEEALEDLLLYEQPEEPGGVFRVKGLVRTDATEGWTLVNAVAGRVDLSPCTPAREPDTGFLVFIGRDLDREALAARCAALELPRG